jgi:ATP/maltotriose-dependent transcriptional regulator MalT
VPRTGTLTLLFTDLVGSTESLVALGEDRYDSVRDEHDALVGGTITAHDGEIVSSAGDFERADRRLDETIAIHEAAGDRYQLLTAHAEAAEMAASRGDVTRAASNLAVSAELARDMPYERAHAILVAMAAYVAYADGRADDAAVLFGTWLSLSPSTFPKRFRPILEELEKEGLREEIAAGKKLSADEAFKRAIEVASRPLSAPD